MGNKDRGRGAQKNKPKLSVKEKKKKKLAAKEAKSGGGGGLTSG